MMYCPIYMQIKTDLKTFHEKEACKNYFKMRANQKKRRKGETND